MDWFERLTGFREDGYLATQARLEVAGRELRSKINGRRFAIGPGIRGGASLHSSICSR